MNTVLRVILLFIGCCFAQHFPNGPSSGMYFNVHFNNSGNPMLMNMTNSGYPMPMNTTNTGNPMPMNTTNTGNPMPENTTNTDPIENFERPCPVYDTYCIRQYFSRHAKCKKAYGPVPEPYYRAQSTVYMPFINITTTLTNIELKGLNGRIEEFYINRETDKLVLAVEFRGININSSRTYFRFHRRGREPIVTSDFLFATYQSLIVTIVIPDLKNLQLDKGEVFTYNNDPRPAYGYGPGIENTKDKSALAAYKQFNGNIIMAAQEAFLTEGVFYIATFIQWSICDFGLEIL